MSALGASGRLGIHLTTLGAGPPERLLDIAAEAGFTGVGLSSHETSRWLEAGSSAAELRRQLRDRGLRADYLDPLTLWLGDGKPSFRKVPDERVIELSVALGIPRVNVIVGGVYDESAAVDAFAPIALRIADAGMTPMIEFAPFFAVSSLHRAGRVIAGAGIPSASVLLDTWHLQRSGGGPADVGELPPGRIATVHLSDAPAAAKEDLMAETMSERRYPGDGAGRVADVLRRVAKHSPEAALTVEVYSPTLRGDDPRAFARQCFRSALAQLEAASIG